MGRRIKRTYQVQSSIPRFLFVSILLLAWFTTGCSRFPQDPRHSLDQVLASGVLRVGAIANPPWVTGAPPDKPGGVEAALISTFADDLGGIVEWRWGPADALFTALADYELDVVIGGITEASPWHTEVAFTVPYFNSHAVVGVPPTAAELTDLDGVTVAIRPDSELRRALEAEGAMVVSQEPLSTAQMPVAADEWEIVGMGFRPTPIQLRTAHHVMAVPRGENALLMRLETVLLAQTRQISLTNCLWEVETE